MKKYLLILLLFCTSCNLITKDKFVGVWNYTKNNKDDASMNGMLATIKKVENTNETYTMNFIGFDLMFTKKDANTLKSFQIKDCTVEYKNDNDLKLIMEDNIYSFTKLK